jgi:multiple sugar transport system permease protein
MVRIGKIKPSDLWKCLLSLFLLALAFIWVMPIIMTVLTSFKGKLEVKKFIKLHNLFPIEWVLTNYEDVFHYPGLPIVQVFRNTLIVCASCIAGVLFISTTAAYAFERLPFKGSDTIFWIIFGLSAIPNVVALVPQYNIYKALGWLDKLPSIIAPLLANVFDVFLVRNFLKGIPKEYDEAGRIDGANEFYIYSQIILPMMKPVLMVVLLFTFNAAWNDFLWPVISITTPSHSTITPSIYMFKNNFGGNPERFLAACTIAIIPTFIIYLFCQKYFLNGIQLGAGIKG